MKPLWVNLNETDQAAFRATIAFLEGRLEERATIEWALKLRPNETVKRIALLELITQIYSPTIKEPWQTAWLLIDEYWTSPPVEDIHSSRVYEVQHRLRGGDKSGSLITLIVELVHPRLLIEPFSALHPYFQNPPKRPKKIEDIFSAQLTSGPLIDTNIFDLDNLTDSLFLHSLATALDAAVDNGLDIARRIGWKGDRSLWRIGGLYRVYYVPTSERINNNNEPDEYHTGIAPSVKLLHSVVTRLAEIDISNVIDIVKRWKLKNTPVHLRLWAAISQNPDISSANEIGSVLTSLDNLHFWEVQDYPEIAELRAKRFSELNHDDQVKILARIRRLPPRNLWPRSYDANQIATSRLYSAVREMRRIEIAGTNLSDTDKVWLESNIVEFSDLINMSHLDDGFLESPRAEWVSPNPDNRYDALSGEDRLKALETALSSTRGGWDDDPATRASDWIRQTGNTDKVLTDLETIENGGAAFTKVWERFGWNHAVLSEQRDNSTECTRVLSLLTILPTESARQAIHGISHWFSSWEKYIVNTPTGLSVWLKFWPITVETTNAQQHDEEEVQLNTVARSQDNNKPMDLDTLNTPAGKLIGVFLTACPNLKENNHPFDSNSISRKMRDAIMTATGRSELIAKHRMIESLNYFLRADPDWTRDNLITPLIDDNVEALSLWRAIARRTHFEDTLKIIGSSMSERAIDRRLDRETRRSLVFSLVIECLHAFQEQREPAVPYTRIQQMIRSLEDEVRAYGAEAIQRFVRDNSVPIEGIPERPTAEQLFQTTATPFLQNVWPQERSLATPGVSRALADLPATAQEAFAEAVNVIEPFLVPFECWSMIEYGLYGEENGTQKLSIIDSSDKASAFLRLLTQTIGTTDGAVIPYDLPDALDQIRTTSPTLVDNKVYRRLATLARRR